MTESNLTGTLLRSGRNGDYRSLGEAGRPVFRVASELRDVLRRKLGVIDVSNGQAYADHFAVPVTDHRGDLIDWYSNIPGYVVPWSSATEDERQHGLAQLKALEQKIKAYIADFDAKKAERNNYAQVAPVSVDAEVFVKLLSKVMFTPDAKHTYLVEGFPVLTFWGFVYPEAKVPADPLLHFITAPKVSATPQAAHIPTTASALTEPPVVEPALQQAAPEPVPVLIKKRSWWRWLWWLLPLLLLLWLLFGLRYCSPKTADRLGVPDLSHNSSSLSFPKFGDFNWPNIPGFGQGNSRALNNGSTPGAGTSASLPEMPKTPSIPTVDQQDQTEPNESPGLPELTDAQPSAEPAVANTPPELEQPAEQTPPSFEPPQLPRDEEAQASQPAASTKGQALEIPTSAPDGQAQFLNGKWRAGAGIQDKNTGKPLRLEYDFNQGQGQVTVQSADGMRCSGDVNAQMSGGQMRINSLGPARCPDGSSFDMPEINCAAGAKSAADCIGNYADARFPMSMRNTQ